MKRLSLLAPIALLHLVAAGAHAAQMHRFDLQSLAFMSSAVIEGDVTSYENIHYIDKLTVKMTHVYAGEMKAGDSVVVGLSAYRKAGKDAFDFQRFGKGDHLILFIQPVTQRPWKEDQVPCWPAPSGLKLIADGHVTGVEQEENPGPYVNTIDEGDAKAYAAKVADAVKWAAAFKQDLEKNRQNQAWLLEQLKSRPQINPEM